jgi:type IV pilus assembly protein PilB
MFRKWRNTDSPQLKEDQAQLDSPELDALDNTGQELWSPPNRAQRKTLEQLLLERGQITEDQLVQAQQVQSKLPGKPMAQVLLSMNAASEGQILSALAETMSLPFQSPVTEAVDPDTFQLLSVEYIRKYQIVPLKHEEDILTVGMVDPTNVFIVDEVKRRTRKLPKVVVITSADLAKIIEQNGSGAAEEVSDIIRDVTEDEIQIIQTRNEDVADLEKLGSESPIIRFVNFMIHDAVRQGASDIHIEPKEKSLKIRYRIDGILFETLTPPQTMHAAIISRLKIMANLDIAERRLPQDGRIRAVISDRKIDLRMSTLPCVFGEKCVIRILDNKSIQVNLEDLGFNSDILGIWKRQIDEPHGILLVTGPTGSGKTTTLYASLRQMDAQRMNISTVEDPIEYNLAAVNQTQVHEKIGMTFAASLRSLLRQDPDVIMLGEVRDGETARTAIQAALTGHLVLSTLHTNDAPSSITRLINIGVEPYLIASAVNCVLAQRLVRKICQNCKEPFVPSDEMRQFLQLQGYDADQTWKGKGCDKCRRTGYSGRLGIYELLVMDDRLRDLVTQNPDVTAFRRMCRERGLVTLRVDGFAKAISGLTTVDEVLRVTESG